MSVSEDHDPVEALRTEIEETRTEMAETVNELSDRLNPKKRVAPRRRARPREPSRSSRAHRSSRRRQPPRSKMWRRRVPETPGNSPPVGSDKWAVRWSWSSRCPWHGASGGTADDQAHLQALGMVAGVIGGVLAGTLFKRYGRLVSGEKSRRWRPTSRGWFEVVLAAGLQGLVYGAVKAFVDRGGAAGFEKATGRWPGTESEPS